MQAITVNEVSYRVIKTEPWGNQVTPLVDQLKGAQKVAMHFVMHDKPRASKVMILIEWSDGRFGFMSDYRYEPEAIA